jgi:hypothetical protein
MRTKKIGLILLLSVPFLLSAQTDIDTIVKVDTIIHVDTLVRVDTVLETVVLVDTMNLLAGSDTTYRIDTLLNTIRTLKIDTVIDIDTIIKVNAVEIKGITYRTSQNFPKDIIGEYLYMKKSGPKVLLNANGSGYFQRKEIIPPKVTYWMVSNKKFEPLMEFQLDGNCFVHVIMRYTDAASRAFYGEFVLVEIKIDYYDGYSVILQERFHKFKK